MTIKHFLLLVLMLPLWSFSTEVIPPAKRNVFSVFRIGVSVKSAKQYLSQSGTILPDGGVTRSFSYSFTSPGNAVVHTGLVVTYNDTVRAMFFKLDREESIKLWHGVVNLYGLPDTSLMLDNPQWIIDSAPFSMYELNGIPLASYRDVEWYEKMNIKHIIITDRDFL